MVAIFGTSGGARLRGGRSARGFGRSPAGVAIRTLQLGQARLSTIPVPLHSSHIRLSLMTAVPDSRRYYTAKALAASRCYPGEAGQRGRASCTLEPACYQDKNSVKCGPQGGRQLAEPTIIRLDRMSELSSADTKASQGTLAARSEI
jgi:hypothetical protein